jgi:uncharacterized protein (DUF2141 family)
VLRANAALKSTVIFGNLDPGRSAVIAFHDENGNANLDRNVLGVPTEPCGLGNAASARRPSTKPPSPSPVATAPSGSPWCCRDPGIADRGK